MSKVLQFPVGNSRRNNRLRHYLNGKFNKYVNLPGTDFLEIGIGDGRFGSMLGNMVASYSGIDINEEYVRIARANAPENKKFTYKVGSAESIPFNSQFDVVFYGESWHYIRDFEQAFREADRVLKPEGIITILEPIEDTTDWASPKLRLDSPEFDIRLLLKKLRLIEGGMKAIFDQEQFTYMEFENCQDLEIDFYVLRRE